MKKSRYEDSEKGERTSGDLLAYFMFHNLVSLVFFFVTTLVLQIYVMKDDIYGYTWIQVIGYLISAEFWELTVFKVFPISIICSVLGRITAYYIIKLYVRYRDRKLKTRRTTKRWGELNRGINRMGVKFIITSFIASFIFTIGVVSVLSYAFFDEVTLLPLMLMYALVKLGTFFFVRWFVGKKL